MRFELGSDLDLSVLPQVKAIALNVGR